MKRWLIVAAGVAVFGPFALVYASAFFGFPITDVPGFATWFMGALTLCGAIAFMDHAVDAWSDPKRTEWGCLLVFGAATAWWGWVLWQMLTQ